VPFSQHSKFSNLAKGMRIAGLFFCGPIREYPLGVTAKSTGNCIQYDPNLLERVKMASIND